MVILFTILAVLQVVAGYICAKGIFYITKKIWLGTVVVLLSTTVPLSICMMQTSFKYDWLVDLICYTGYFYLGFTLYFSIYCILAFFTARFYKKIKLRKILSPGLGCVCMILFIGYLNAVNPVLKKITIPADVNARICFISDIHVGSISTKKLLNRVADLVVSINPDLVILGGDTLDMQGTERFGGDFVNIMGRITSKYKTYAVIGNHEIYSGVWNCIDLLKKTDISMLLDQYTEEYGFTIVGRLDRTVSNRKPLHRIIPENAKNLIVIDHAPNSVDESIQNNALLHLSGHTHGGQMFPMNIITDILYQPTGVLEKIRNTYSYITFGVGFWGPPYRIGNRPEVVLIEFVKKEAH